MDWTPIRGPDLLGPNNLFHTPSATREPTQYQGCTYDERSAMQTEFDEMCEKIYGLLIGCLGSEPIKRIKNDHVLPGDGVSAIKVLDKE